MTFFVESTDDLYLKHFVVVMIPFFHMYNLMGQFRYGISNLESGTSYFKFRILKLKWGLGCVLMSVNNIYALRTSLFYLLIYAKCIPDINIESLRHETCFSKSSNFCNSFFSTLFVICCSSFLIKYIAEFRELCCLSFKSSNKTCSFVDFNTKIQIKSLKCLSIADKFLRPP